MEDTDKRPRIIFIINLFILIIYNNIIIKNNKKSSKAIHPKISKTSALGLMQIS